MVIKIKDSEIIDKELKEDQTLSRQYFVPEIMKKVLEKEKQSLSLQSECVDDATLKRIGSMIRESPHIKKINLMENKISNFDFIAEIFCKVERIVLSNIFLNQDNNRIKELPIKCEKMKEIKYLYLKETNLEVISSSIGNLRQLQVLEISWNQNLKEIPD